MRTSAGLPEKRHEFILTGATAERHEFILTVASGHLALTIKREKPRTQYGEIPVVGECCFHEIADD